MAILADLEPKERSNVNTANFTVSMQRLKATKRADKPAASPPTIAEVGRIAEKPQATPQTPPTTAITPATPGGVAATNIPLHQPLQQPPGTPSKSG